MKAGFYADELEEVTDLDDINDVAIWFADEKHEICESSDISFQVFVEDNNGVIHQFNMGTDFDPVYHVESSEIITQK
tara:strand:+ start:308 stop:538 length:231 start_codon:yes stop_codon:yes gene_type:complete